MHLITRALHWMAAEAREKVDLRAKWAEIKEIGKVWGPRFVIFALLWELFEDAVCPTLTIYFGGITIPIVTYLPIIIACPRVHVAFGAGIVFNAQAMDIDNNIGAGMAVLADGIPTEMTGKMAAVVCHYFIDIMTGVTSRSVAGFNDIRNG